MFWYYLISLIPLYLLVRNHREFGWYSAYFIFNWVVVSASVLVSSLVSADLVELGTVAASNFAAVAFNLSLAFNLFFAAFTYQKLRVVGVKASSCPRTTTVRLERRLFGALVVGTAIIAMMSLLPTPPVITGMPVSEFLATLNAVQRFSFISLAIAALPLSSLARGKFLSERWRAVPTALTSLLPAIVWVLAGEKMGYLLFILFCTALPWVQTPLKSHRLKVYIAIVGLASLLLTILQYALRDDNPLLLLGARAAMQGQLWYYFYLEAPVSQSIDFGIRLLLGLGGTDSIRTMMEIAMPANLFFEYETATMTGSHMPALLLGAGWVFFPIALALSGALFGLATTLVRLALQTDYLLMSYLIVACFVFPGVEIWVGGNFSRLVTLPPTFLLLTIACVPLVLSRIKLRINRARCIPPHCSGLVLDANPKI